MSLSLVLATVTLALGGISILLALVVVRENPRHRLNWVLATLLLCAGSGAVFGASDLAVSSAEPKLLRVRTGLLTTTETLWEFIFPAFLLFTLLFPRPHRAYTRVPGLGWLIFWPYITHLLLVTAGPPPAEGGWFDVVAGAVPALAGVVGGLNLGARLAFRFDALLFPLVNLTYVVLGFVSMRAARRRAQHPGVRQQLRVILFGTGACFCLYAVAEPLPTFLGMALEPVTRTGMICAGLSLASLSVAYSIVRYRFLDMKVIARRTILYGAASGVVLALYLLLVHSQHEAVAEFLGVPRRAMEIAFLVVALMIFQPVAGRLEELLEGLLLRDKSDYRVAVRGLAAEVSTVLDLPELGNRVSEMLAASVMVDSGAFLARRALNGPLEVLSSFGLDGALDSKLAAELTGGDLPAAELPYLEEWSAAAGVEAPRAAGRLFVVPLRHAGELLGVLLVGPKLTGRRFNTEDRALLATLGDQLGVALRNTHLHDEALRRRLLEEELRFARRVQETFLPARFPELPALDVAAQNLPSKEVGGDYVDAMQVDPETLVVAIGDVSGKGVPAALLMSMTRAALRTRVLNEHSPGRILRDLNALIHDSTSPAEFVTFFLGCVRSDCMQLTYSNGGHDRPLLRRRDGSLEWLADGGLLLGAVKETQFDEGQVQLYPGDLLVLYTDGLTEAERHGEMYGGKRLEALVRQTGTERTADQVVRDLVRANQEWTGGEDQADDMTLLVLRVRANGQSSQPQTPPIDVHRVE